MLIIDESSLFKNHRSLRFEALQLVLETFSRIVLLTGTPTPNGLMDLWAQIKILDYGKRLGHRITHYRKAYFYNDSYGGYTKYVARETALDKITALVEDICLSMKSEDYLDMPPIIESRIDIELPEPVGRLYRKFRREKVLELYEEATIITAANAAALSNKLLQFTGGAVYDDPEYEGQPSSQRSYKTTHKLKLDALEEIVETRNEPVLIIYQYRHELERIKKRLKKHQPISIKDKNAVERWNRGEIRVMCLHPASGGHGLNLQDGGRIMVWYGLTWNLEYYLQTLKRLHRQGQTGRVYSYILNCLGTIDERVATALLDKKSGQDALLDAVSDIRKQETAEL